MDICYIPSIVIDSLEYLAEEVMRIKPWRKVHIHLGHPESVHFIDGMRDSVVINASYGVIAGTYSMEFLGPDSFPRITAVRITDWSQTAFYCFNKNSEQVI